MVVFLFNDGLLLLFFSPPPRCPLLARSYSSATGVGASGDLKSDRVCVLEYLGTRDLSL